MFKISKPSKVYPLGKKSVSLEEVYGPIRADLLKVETELGRICSLPRPSDQKPNLLRVGGKRVRPALVLLSSLFGRGSCPEQVRLAVSVEILHLATLVHDDVIDCAESRRGERTVNELLGKNSAVLTGDFLYALFLEQIAGLGVEAISSLAGTLKDMVRAEFDQQQALFNCNTGEKNYLRRISRKTGSFISCCCKLGARIAGATGEVTCSLERFGWLTGISFQIKDDLLDFVGDAGSLGKPVAQDLRQGVLTLPVIHALANSPRKNELRSLIERKDISAASLDFLIGEMQVAGSLAYTERTAKRYAWLAQRVLSTLPQNDARESLNALLNFILARER